MLRRPSVPRTAGKIRGRENEEVGMASMEGALRRETSREGKVPEDFLFGVSNAGFQVEGGYNVPGGPHNNWAAWEREGKVQRPGAACRFWEKYLEHVELASSLGLNAFRFSLEWSRIQPGTEGERNAPPPFDQEALNRYAAIASAIMDAGMEPVITLHHFTHPAWCGTDLWLDPDGPQLFAEYVRQAVTGLNRRLLQQGKRAIRLWVTINEPNILGLLMYVLGEHPHGKKGLVQARKATENLVIAHVRAYNAIHDAYEEMGWGQPLVSFNNYGMCFYALDKALYDLVRAPSRGVRAEELPAYLKEKRKAWRERFDRLAAEKWGRGSLRFRYYLLLENIYNRLADPSGSRRSVEAIYGSPRGGLVDYIALDIYDPFSAANPPKLPSPRRLREGEPLLYTPLWENFYRAGEFGGVIRGYAEDAGSLPIYILENGMCHRQPLEGGPFPRRDGLTRDVFLRDMLGEVAACLQEGIRLKAYSYWSLTDNYEWGSFEPRFGLYEYDFRAGRILERDGLGKEAGRTYAQLVEDLRAGGRGRS